MQPASRKGLADDVISDRFVGPLVLDKRVKFHYPSSNRSREILWKPSAAAFSTVSLYNFRPEADIARVISGMAIDNVGVDVPVIFGDSRSNGFRDIRGAPFLSDERTKERTRAYPQNEALTSLFPKL